MYCVRSFCYDVRNDTTEGRSESAEKKAQHRFRPGGQLGLWRYKRAGQFGCDATH